ncbi:MAG TPA: Maf family protein [Candidatus Sulfotelmatobacter sp.]|nr:Maf family protein [Candidatus Sulfotelmatobacter sp.]
MLVLASASPRRQELLRHAGISFAVHPADVDETPLPRESARACAERLARDKALKVWRERPQDLVLGADTVVVIDEAILGKPVDPDDAARMLRMLSGREHHVITGVCLVRAGFSNPQSKPGPGRTAKIGDAAVTTASETTAVTMSEIPEEEIRSYIASGEPMDKAGAYAIQGVASRWIPRIEGDYSNVVGLPVDLVCRMLRES